MSNNPFENYEILEPWFAEDKAYRTFKKLSMLIYLQEHKLNRNLIMSTKETYLTLSD